MISQKKRLHMSCKHNLVSSNLVHPIKNGEGKKFVAKSGGKFKFSSGCIIFCQTAHVERR